MKTIECKDEKEFAEAHTDMFACTGSEGYDLMTRPLVLFARKKKRLPPVQQNAWMLWGKRLQDTIAKGFAEDTGRKVELAAPWHPAAPRELRR